MTDELTETLRIEGGHVLATLVRLTGDFGLAEDALQEAVMVALERWPESGVPSNPAGWLTTTARNRALDHLRRESNRTRKETEAMALLEPDPLPPPDGIDDRLRLLFTCCHPALSVPSQVALALRTICGLTTSDIARLLLVPEPTIGQRISRAKRKIAAANIPYRVPDDHELPDRLPPVLKVIYLVFTTGHHAPRGVANSRIDLAEEGVRLARLLAELMPDESEVRGLEALTIATHARRRARLTPGGDPILMADQDRRLWDRLAIDEATRIVEDNLRRGAGGPYLLQAAISCLHGLAPSFEDTDWHQIAELYRMLEAAEPSPVVRVNRSVAVAMVSGAESGLELLDGIATVGNWHLYWTTRGELLDRAGRRLDAADAYRRALSCDMNDTDRRFCEQRLAELTADRT